MTPARRPVELALAVMASITAGLIMLGNTALAQAEAQPITDDTFQLAPGTWVDESNGAHTEFTVEDGWLVYGAPIDQVGIAIGREDYPDVYLTITNFGGGVFGEPCLTAESGESFWEGSMVEATAHGLADHLAAHPFVSVTDTTPIEVGGYGGLQLDMVTSVPSECDPPWAWLWQLPEVGDFHLDDRAQARFIVLDVRDHVTVIAAEGYDEGQPGGLDWSGFLDELTDLTDSMVIVPIS